MMIWFGHHTQGTEAAAEASVDESFLDRLKWPGTSVSFPESFRILIGVAVNDGIPGAPESGYVNIP